MELLNSWLGLTKPFGKSQMQLSEQNYLNLCGFLNRSEISTIVGYQLTKELLNSVKFRKSAPFEWTNAFRLFLVLFVFYGFLFPKTKTKRFENKNRFRYLNFARYKFK